MIEFNPEGKETLSYGESIGPLLEIRNACEALNYFHQYVNYLAKKLPDEPSPRSVAKVNVLYYLGYYGNAKEIEQRILSFNLW